MNPLTPIIVALAALVLTCDITGSSFSRSGKSSQLSDVSATPVDPRPSEDAATAQVQSSPTPTAFPAVTESSKATDPSTPQAGDGYPLVPDEPPVGPGVEIGKDYPTR